MKYDAQETLRKAMEDADLWAQRIEEEETEGTNLFVERGILDTK